MDYAKAVVVAEDPWGASPKDLSRAAGEFTRTSTEVISMADRKFTPARERELAAMLVGVLQAKATRPLVWATWALAAMTAALVAATVVLAVVTAGLD